jgi:hypothetical protein
VKKKQSASRVKKKQSASRVKKKQSASRVKKEAERFARAKIRGQILLEILILDRTPATYGW